MSVCGHNQQMEHYTQNYHNYFPMRMKTFPGYSWTASHLFSLTNSRYNTRSVFISSYIEITSNLVHTYLSSRFDVDVFEAIDQMSRLCFSERTLTDCSSRYGYAIADISITTDGIYVWQFSLQFSRSIRIKASENEQKKSNKRHRARQLFRKWKFYSACDIIKVIDRLEIYLDLVQERLNLNLQI